MDVRWSKGCVIPTSESSHVQPLTCYNTFIDNMSFSREQKYLLGFSPFAIQLALVLIINLSMW